ncbi:HAD-IA family hydrolase [Rhodovulum euryhalinum]|uniref:Phosphoglycolate phosphatase n=1 Tax=Rhodovulum euryhalinum TaxID=35805 RepID=A0A4R2KLG3_9RHOB|nr:HAD-IA family hydrolase [Rhodovulum euryhalinum]TCO71526.1 phosphoglycolate phosphatase [Rhodovulum euryhalinum]
MTALRLVIFDVDGTLVDSQSHIAASMAAAFQAEGLAVPPLPAILGVVGLSLPVAIARLAPDLPGDRLARMVEGYRQQYFALRVGTEASPLYPGARAAVETLAAADDTLLGIATGKSRRGLDAILETHALGSHFVTRQSADDHPSKPHPAMVLAALSETGVAPENAVMIGDTEFDIEMGRAAGVRTLGVTWGYHAPDRLAAADAVIDSFASLPAAVDRLRGG